MVILQEQLVAVRLNGSGLPSRMKPPVQRLTPILPLASPALVHFADTVMVCVSEPAFVVTEPIWDRPCPPRVSMSVDGVPTGETNDARNSRMSPTLVEVAPVASDKLMGMDYTLSLATPSASSQPFVRSTPASVSAADNQVFVESSGLITSTRDTLPSDRTTFSVRTNPGMRSTCARPRSRPWRRST